VLCLVEYGDTFFENGKLTGVGDDLTALDLALTSNKACDYLLFHVIDALARF
jgi:hypothetical protein